MATEKTTSTNKINITPIQSAFQEVDMAGQNLSNKIRAMCHAGMALAATGKASPTDLKELFKAIADLADDASNYINSEAEQHGCNFVEDSH